MRLRLVVATVGLIGVLAVGLPGAFARSGSDPGVTPNSILLGGTVPLTGDEVAYAALARGAEAYFKYVNARGGVRGREIRYLYLDDQYNPAETARKTRQLVQDEKVFAIFNSVGTEHVLAVRPYLNQAGVPQLFVGSGHSLLALEHKRYPWSMGYLPRFAGEGALYGRYIARTRPRAKIGVLHEDSEYGQDMFAGLRRGLGKLSSRITAVKTYKLSDTDVNSQISRLKSSGADTIMIFALPTQTIQAFLAIRKLGWRPRIFVNSVSIDPFVMEVVQKNTGKQLVEGAISSAFLKDPTDPALAGDPGVKLYKQILRRYLPRAKVKEVAHLYGMAVAYTMVDALRRSGAEPSRSSLLRAATHLDERANPFFVKGIAVKTGPDDYYPVEKTRMLRFHAGRWRQFGGLASVR
ncbi:MAG: ABC transporter substrate-binding protein [Actinomycetota bacterium]